MNHFIVGIMGPKRSGKDTAAKLLVRYHRFRTCSFASFLKEGCRSFFMLSHDQLYGEQKDVIDPRWNTTPRRIYQVVGTDMLRKQLKKFIPEINMGSDTTIWCRDFRFWLDNFKTPQRIVVPDVRFKDEANLIRDLGGIIIQIDRPSVENNDSHESEQEYKSIQADVTITNDGTISSLEEKVTEFIKRKLPPPEYKSVIKGLKLNNIPKNVNELYDAEEIEYKPRKRNKKE